MSTIINPFRFCGDSGGEAGGSSYLDGVISSVCCDLDATISGSYGGSGQSWANLISAPADGSAQTDYDFYLGSDASTSTNDPTFTGTADTPSAYFSLDGGDYFTCTTSSGTILQRANMTSGTGCGPCWFAFAFQLGAINTNIAFFGNTGNTVSPGIRFLMNATENLRLLQGGDSSGFNQPVIPDGTWTAANDYLLLITMDSTNAGNEKYWVNSTTGSSWAASYTPSTSTSEPSNAMRIGTDPSTAFVMPNNTRLYHFSCGNELLDDTKAAAIFAHLETRHSRDYTP